MVSIKISDEHRAGFATLEDESRGLQATMAEFVRNMQQCQSDLIGRSREYWARIKAHHGLDGDWMHENGILRPMTEVMAEMQAAADAKARQAAVGSDEQANLPLANGDAPNQPPRGDHAFLTDEERRAAAQSRRTPATPPMPTVSDPDGHLRA